MLHFHMLEQQRVIVKLIAANWASSLLICATALNLDLPSTVQHHTLLTLQLLSEIIGRQLLALVIAQPLQ